MRLNLFLVEVALAGSMLAFGSAAPAQPAGAAGAPPVPRAGPPKNAPNAPSPANAAQEPKPGDPYAAFFPSPKNTPFFRPDQIPWKTNGEGLLEYNLFGNPREPGPYAVLLKWLPGHYSTPHYHPNARYAVVISGTWWTSTSNVQDVTKTYPLGPGTVVTDVIGTVHWDGARDEPVVLMLMGDGPSPNVKVDKNGKPLGAVEF